MWSYVFAFLAFLFFALAVLLFVAAGKEIERRDKEWKKIVEDSQQRQRNSDKSNHDAVNRWIIALNTEKDKVSQAKSEVAKLNNQVTEMGRTISFQMTKITELESLKKTKGKKDDSGMQNSAKLTRVLECVICLESAPMTVIVPCGHLAACVSCAKCMESPTCPVCRSLGTYYNVYDATKQIAEPDKNEKIDLHPDEVVKRKGMIRRFLDKF